MNDATQSTSIGRKIIALVFLIGVLYTATFSIHTFLTQRKDIIEGHLDLLTCAALAVPELLPEGFHERVLEVGSVSEEEYLRTMWKMTDWAHKAGVSFVYSFVRRGDTLHFTSTSGTEKQRRDGTWVPFFEPYEASEGVWSIFETHQAQHEAAKDEYGHFLSVVMPMTNQTGEVYLVGADIYSDEIRALLHQTLIRGAIMALLIFVIGSCIGIWISNRITHPLIVLAKETRRLTEHGFAVDADFTKNTTAVAQSSRDEVGRLAGAIIQMVQKLQDYIDNIKRFTAAQERIESELNIARNIQMSFLPKVFPPFPEHKQFDIYATLEPAREVGGDLYDFFMLDEHHLFVAVGDVSGKGVPSALFMAVTKTLFKGMAHPNLSPSTIMERVNNELRENNEALMFVTLFCGILDIRTGLLTYANAGHNPPVLLRRQEAPHFLEIPRGFILGVEEFSYESQSIQLQPGDQLLLYTDGVTEAMNPNLELYGDHHLIDIVSTVERTDPKHLVETIMKSVVTHANGEPQSDDVTILSLLYNGS